MLTLINENMEQCIKEFYELYNSDDYIPKKYMMILQINTKTYFKTSLNMETIKPKYIKK